jgi:hypothetical protein
MSLGTPGAHHPFFSCALGGAKPVTEENIMALSGTTQQVVEYLKSNPDMARKAMDSIKTNPGGVKNALKDVAAERGWDLSQLDTAELTKQLGSFNMPH